MAHLCSQSVVYGKLGFSFLSNEKDSVSPFDIRACIAKLISVQCGTQPELVANFHLQEQQGSEISPM
jgi:hypothetical protein